MKKLGLILLVLGMALFIMWSIVRIIASYSFSMQCEDYLKRAADANTIELAGSQLDKALTYMEDNDLTDGVVSIFLKQPKNDVGFWYTNIKTAREQLDKVPADSSELEKSNVLMKLRETLTDSASDGGTVITVPNGISVYPNNAVLFWICIIGIMLMILGGILLLYDEF